MPFSSRPGEGKGRGSRRGIVLTAIVLFGCGGDSDPELVWLPAPSDWVPVPFEEIAMEQLDCIATHWVGLEVVIRTQAQYDSLLALPPPSPFGCTGLDPPPEIDFSEESLVGKDMVGGGCSADFEIEVYRVDDDRKYVYRVRIVNHGTCPMIIEKNTWLLVPRLEPGYDVEFETLSTHD